MTTKVVLRPSDNQIVENQIVDRVVTTKGLTTKVLATKMVDQGGDQVNNQCVDNQIVHLERFNSSSLLRVSANSAWILSRTVPVGWKRVFCFYWQSVFFSSDSSSGFAWWAIFVQFHFLLHLTSQSGRRLHFWHGLQKKEREVNKLLLFSIMMGKSPCLQFPF